MFIVDCKENKQFGLNSYLLYRKQPVFDAHTIALKQVEQLLVKLDRLKLHYKNIPTVQQHSFFIPVAFEPQSWIQQPKKGDFESAARWVIHNYDYQCAKQLLNQFQNTGNSGPYIVSRYSNHLPKTNNQQRHRTLQWSAPVLIQNLSDVSLESSGYWLTEFLKKSWQPKLWDKNHLNSLSSSMQESLFLQYIQQNEQKHNLMQEKESQPALWEVAKDIPSKFSANLEYPVTPRVSKPTNPYLKKIAIQSTIDSKNH